MVKVTHVMLPALAVWIQSKLDFKSLYVTLCLKSQNYWCRNGNLIKYITL